MAVGAEASVEDGGGGSGSSSNRLQWRRQRWQWQQLRTMVAVVGGDWRRWRQVVDEGGRRALIFLDNCKRSNAYTSNFIRSEINILIGISSTLQLLQPTKIYNPRKRFPTRTVGNPSQARKISIVLFDDSVEGLVIGLVRIAKFNG